MLMHILAYNAYQDIYLAYDTYFRNAYLCICFCIFLHIFCIYFVYIPANNTYILHISFVHIVHIFFIFGTAYSCIFWNAYFCILMHIMQIYAYFEFACTCIIYISFRHSLAQIGDVGFCGRFRAWFKVSQRTGQRDLQPSQIITRRKEHTAQDSRDGSSWQLDGKHGWLLGTSIQYAITYQNMHKICHYMHKICMYKLKICIQYAEICIAYAVNMHVICIKYAIT